MDAYARLREELDRERVVIIDGGTGTELERRGAEMHEKAWCAMATLTAPDVLRDIHEDYIRAGSRIVTANTFSSNRNMLEPAGLGHHFEELNRSAVAIALEARDRCGAGDRVVVAGSLSHQVPVVADADQRHPDLLPSADIAAERFREMARVLAEAGSDMVLIEMMSDPTLANFAIDAVCETGLPFWIGFSVRADEDGQPVSYSMPGMPASEMFRAISLEGADAAGVMHSNVDVTGAGIEQLRAVWPGPIAAYPDSGYFTMPHWHFENIISPADLVERTREWKQSGARVFGGCCGLGIEHIEALVRAWAA